MFSSYPQIAVRVHDYPFLFILDFANSQDDDADALLPE
jgi:hypothetical protein